MDSRFERFLSVLAEFPGSDQKQIPGDAAIHEASQEKVPCRPLLFFPDLYFF
jgi:hypothetical protein